MAEIRTIVNPDTMSRDTPNPSRVFAATPTPGAEAFLANATAMSRIGEDFQNLGAQIYARDQQLKAQQEADLKREQEKLKQLNVNKALNELTPALSGIHAEALQNQDALTDPAFRDSLLGKAREAKQSVMDKLTPDEQEMFDLHADPRVNALGETLVLTGARISYQQEQEVFKQGIQSNLDVISKNPNDEILINSAAEAMREAIDQKFSHQDTENPVIQQQMIYAHTQLEKQINTTRVIAMSQTNPVQALAFYNNNSDWIQDDNGRLRDSVVKAAIPQIASSVATYGINYVVENEADKATLEKAASVAGVPANITVGDPKDGDPLIQSIGFDGALDVLGKAHSINQESIAAYKTAVTDKVAGGIEYARATGKTDPNFPTNEDIIKAYGNKAPAIIAEFEYAKAYGSFMTNITKLPNSEIAKQLKEEPLPGDNYESRKRYYDAELKAASDLYKARKIDPMGEGVKAGTVPAFTEEDFKDANGIIKAISNRVSSAVTIRESYETPLKLLANGEAEHIANILSQGTAVQQKQFLQGMLGGINSKLSGPEAIAVYKGLMSELKIKDPVFASAGVYYANGYKTTTGRDVGDLLLKGQEIINPKEGMKSTVVLPSDEKMKIEFNDIVKNAYGEMTNTKDLDFAKTKAIYATLSSEAGEVSQKEINRPLWKQAMNLSIGGVQPYQGKMVVMPYGRKIDEFTDGIKGSVDFSMQNQRPTATRDDIAKGELLYFGDKKYLVKTGAGIVLDQKTGKPFVLNWKPYNPNKIGEGAIMPEVWKERVDQEYAKPPRQEVSGKISSFPDAIRFAENSKVNAVSPKGAKGTMQVLDATNIAPGYGVAPARNNSLEERDRVGRDYANALLAEFKDPELAAMAYNWGPKNVKDWIASGKPMNKVPKETKDYVARIKPQLLAMNQ